MEEEFQRQTQEFVKQLKHYPQVGRRPFGYPKSAWCMSGAMGFFGLLLQFPLLLSEEVNRNIVLWSVFGILLFSCAFAMRMGAFTMAAAGAMDRWLYEEIQALKSEPPDKGNAEPGAAPDHGLDPVNRDSVARPGTARN